MTIIIPEWLGYLIGISFILSCINYLLGFVRIILMIAVGKQKQKIIMAALNPNKSKKEM